MTFSNDLVTARDDEVIVELFYKARINERWVLQPDLQYLSSPGGVNRDAVVFGFRFEANL